MYENWLARVENDARRVLQLILHHQQLSQQDRVIWSAFVASLFVRTRKYRKQISDAMVRKFKEQTQNPEFIRTMQHEMLQEGVLHHADDLRKDVEKLRAAMDRSPSYYHVSGLQRHTEILANALMGKKWHTVDAPPGKHFLISDCPVVTAELQGNQGLPGAGFGKPNTAVFLPITSRNLFVASPHNWNWRSVAEPRAVDMANRLIVQFGHRNVYAGLSSLEVQSLVDAGINHIVFGQNAFVPN
jgi:hypothetical protein